MLRIFRKLLENCCVNFYSVCIFQWSDGAEKKSSEHIYIVIVSVSLASLNLLAGAFVADLIMITRDHDHRNSPSPQSLQYCIQIVNANYIVKIEKIVREYALVRANDDVLY